MNRYIDLEQKFVLEMSYSKTFIHPVYIQDNFSFQQLALSAGYFFKCPLCNNKKDFQTAMLEYGIFVPSQ